MATGEPAELYGQQHTRESTPAPPRHYHYVIKVILDLVTNQMPVDSQKVTSEPRTRSLRPCLERGMWQ